jgi:SAM-dependent methyltransferase
MPDHRRAITVFPGFVISSEDVFLDIGCGDGHDCRSAATVGADVIAIDIVKDHVDATTEAVKGLGARSYRGIVSDCEPIPLPDSCASVIFCLEVMEHVADPVLFLKELVRVGKPGARYALSVPAAPSESLMKILAPPSYFEPPGHLRIFELHQFEGLIRDSGLEIDGSAGVGFYSTIWWTLRMACGTSFLSAFPESPPPILWLWEKTWKELETAPHGSQAIEALDNLLPKSYRIVAHKS